MAIKLSEEEEMDDEKKGKWLTKMNSKKERLNGGNK